MCMIFLLFGGMVVAQETSEEQEVQKVIETFFEGFHARDSLVMKSVMADEIIIQSIGKDKTGKPKLAQEEPGRVLKGIVSIPLETNFKEVLHSYDIKTDGAMANAWVPYSFYLNETFSHCGVNNFQLLKKKGEWKIIYLIDTRRREGCEEKKMK